MAQLEAYGLLEAATDDASFAPVSERDPLEAGTELDGRFRVVRKLGRGGMGQIYEATDIRLGRSVAVKVLRSASGASLQLRKRFEREARAVAQVQHEHVVTVFDYGIGPTGEPYLVMEYLEGQDLRCLLREQGQIAPPRAVRLIHDACLGLAAAHAKGVIHRDLKPENLFAAAHGRRFEICKVLDFGLAKLRMADGCDLQTRAGVPFGTLHYMSPEQARGESNVDERTDIYSAAAVLYELLSGERPHTADSAHALLYMITHESPARLEQRCAYLPPGLADAVHGGLAADRGLRPVSIDAFARSLEPFTGLRELGLASLSFDTAFGGDRETRPDILVASTPATPVSRWLRQSRYQAALIVASTIGTVGLLWLTGERPAAPYAAPGERLELARVELPSTPERPSSAQSQPLPSAPPLVETRVGDTSAPKAASRPVRRASEVVSTGAPEPGVLVSAPRSGVDSGFDRENPYEASTAAAR